jgi:transketolase
MDSTNLKMVCKRIRYNIITSTTAAGSGHPSSSLSATELTAVLFFGGFFKQDIANFQNPLNDKFVLSKGHAAPLLYSLYEAAGVLKHEELLTLRKFDSRLQGHPTPAVPFVDVSTGSLGQGLSIGVGMALGLQKKSRVQSLESRVPNVFVLLGDSEFAEGQNYEAMQLASYYKLSNLVVILDVNRLGQRGETQLGWDIETYKKRAEAFGWNAIIIEDGNDITQVQLAFSKLLTTLRLRSGQAPHNLQPTILIAKTVKGAGVSFMENADGWHGKAIPKDKLDEALTEIGEIDFSIVGKIEKPISQSQLNQSESTFVKTSADKSVKSAAANSTVSTREAYGHALADLAKQNSTIIALDAETSNSTYAEYVKKETPEQFIECYIAEQNMVGMALGLSKLGFIPFASSFAAFLTRAYDQIRMSQYSISQSQLNQSESVKSAAANSTNSTGLTNSTLNIVGSHAGCSIGPDGASQMALEDISMMRSIRDSVVLYPADGLSAYKLTLEMAKQPGIKYLRTTRDKTPTIYKPEEEFPIGGLKVHYLEHGTRNVEQKDLSVVLRSPFDVLIVSAGITLHEALKAQKQLEEKQIHTIVVDLYSIKPFDSKTLIELVKKTKHLIVVEDHYESGGIGEAVLTALSESSVQGLEFPRFTHLCVRKEPRSGTMEELLRYEEIDAETIIKIIEEKS